MIDQELHVILNVISTAPEYGGQARSVPNLAQALAEQGVRVSLVCIDTGEDPDSRLLPDHPLVDNIIMPHRLMIGMRPVFLPGYRTILTELVNESSRTIIHDNGVWLPHNGHAAAVSRSQGIPLVTTPRGMLEPWAVNYRSVRKRAAWLLFQKHRLQQADVLHATSQAEAEQLRRLGLRNAIAVIPNGTEIPRSNPGDQNKGRKAKKQILFLSRIHPKKGLLNLVEAVRQLNLNEWEIVLAGYDEDNHQQEVQNAVHEAGLSNIFQFIGPVRDEDKWGLYSEADLFILPSFSENFGIVVAEALAAGTPVITTTGTPWKAVEENHCGWWVKPTITGLVESLQEAVNLPDHELEQMGQRGRDLVIRKYSWTAVAEKVIEVYQWLMDCSLPPPSSIQLFSD